MSGDKYFITDKHSLYFITCTVIHGIDLFTRKEYRDIVVDSLNYCINEKNVELYGWVIMSNHIDVIARCKHPGSMSKFLRDFKNLFQKDLLMQLKIPMKAGLNGCLINLLLKLN